MTDDVTLSRRVGLEIKVLLLRRGMSGRRLAQHLGESQTWLSARLAGTTPIDLNDLERIAVALGLDPVDLLRSVYQSTTLQYPITPAHAVDVRSGRAPGSRSRFRQRAEVAA